MRVVCGGSCTHGVDLLHGARAMTAGGSTPCVDGAPKKTGEAFASPAHVHHYLHPCVDQVSRNAVVIGNRAARSAGNKPPTRPMPSAHFKPVHSSSGDTWNLNTTALKLLPIVDTL